MNRRNDILETWVDIGDQRECPDCKALSGRTESRSYWDDTGRPRERNTVCNGNCRCMLIPSDISDEEILSSMDRIIDEVVDEYMGRIIVDKKRGGTIILKDFDQVKGMADLPYSTIAELESLIFEYKKNGDTLPAEYYKLADVEKQIEWLRGNL